MKAMQRILIAGALLSLLPLGLMLGANAQPQKLQAQSLGSGSVDYLTGGVPQMAKPVDTAVKMASTVPTPAIAFRLSDYQWRYRPVLVFAPSEQTPAYRQQLQQWQAQIQEIRDRDMRLIEVFSSGESRASGQPITAAAANQLRRQLGVAPERFTVILVGKDGTEKQRASHPVHLTTLFRTIDAMPMRQREMQRRR